MGYSLGEILDLPREEELSSLVEFSKVQSSFALKVRLRAQKMASFLLDEKGKIDRSKLEQLLTLLKKEGFILYPYGANDGNWTIYVRRILTVLAENPTVFLPIQSIGLPLCNSQAHEYVADSIGDFPNRGLTDILVRSAILSAILTPLRQSIGSCFATAPAILIQEQQIQRLIKDLIQILLTGQLKVVIDGREFSVPMSPTAGSGDLERPVDLSRVLFSPALQPLIKTSEPIRGNTVSEILENVFEGEELRRAKARFVAFVDHPLLKVWEFTLASFSESKMEFSRWHLTKSLGFDHEESGGLGALLYEHLDRRLQEENAQATLYQNEVNLAFDQVKATERLLRQASSENESRRLRAEHQSRLYQFHSCLERRDIHIVNSTQFSQFFSFLLKAYEAEFPHHFQEIYDADMGDLIHAEYKDSPAGFRLVYKQGRSQAGSWSFIKTAEEYLRALRDFFLMTESSISSRIDWEEGRKELEKLTTAVSHHLQTKEFLLNAFQRIYKARKAKNAPQTIEELDTAPLKPWAYISGGSMSILLKMYFQRDKMLSEENLLCENPTELCIFLIDLLKTRSSEGRLLMSSPTHAFSMLPSSLLLQQASDSRIFTYTWIRDNLIFPMQSFYGNIFLSPEEQLFLANKAGFSSSFSSSVSPKELLAQFPSLDGFLFASLPLISANEWKRKATDVLAAAGREDAIGHLISPSSYLTRQEAHAALINACTLAQKSLLSARDLHLEISLAMRQQQLAPPEPLMFADTNWDTFFFAFLVNPGTEELELWRIDRIGLTGQPMKEWHEYFSASSKEPWTIYINPEEYRS